MKPSESSCARRTWVNFYLDGCLSLLLRALSCKCVPWVMVMWKVLTAASAGTPLWPGSCAELSRCPGCARSSRSSWPSTSLRCGTWPPAGPPPGRTARPGAARRTARSRCRWRFPTASPACPAAAAAGWPADSYRQHPPCYSRLRGSVSPGGAAAHTPSDSHTSLPRKRPGAAWRPAVSRAAGWSAPDGQVDRNSSECAAVPVWSVLSDTSVIQRTSFEGSINETPPMMTGRVINESFREAATFKSAAAFISLRPNCDAVNKAVSYYPLLMIYNHNLCS